MSGIEWRCQKRKRREKIKWPERVIKHSSGPASIKLTFIWHFSAFRVAFQCSTFCRKSFIHRKTRRREREILSGSSPWMNGMTFFSLLSLRRGEETQISQTRKKWKLETDRRESQRHNPDGWRRCAIRQLKINNSVKLCLIIDALKRCGDTKCGPMHISDVDCESASESATTTGSGHRTPARRGSQRMFVSKL